MGNHDFFFKNVKMMDLYDNKKLSTGYYSLLLLYFFYC